jgi:flagellar export protein FliJ
VTRSFKFQLETVRKLRRQELDACRREVAEATRAVVALQSRLATLNESARTNVQGMRTSQASQAVLDLPQIRMLYAHHGYIARQMVEAELHLVSSRKKLNSSIEVLKQANSRAKAIEKLYERQKERFDLASRKKDQRDEDEQALRMAVTKRNQSAWV